MATRAVLLDLGNTLVAYYRRGEFSDVLRRCVHEAVRAAGLSGAEVNEAELFERARELNRESPDFAVRPLAGRLRELVPGCAHSPPELMERVCRAFMAPIFSCARADADAASLLDALRGRGLRTAVVSNTPWGSPAEYWREELDRHGLLARLDAALNAAVAPPHLVVIPAWIARRDRPIPRRPHMCRNIKTLANFEPPATDDEVRASALQFVRKLSGCTRPSRANELAFNRAVDEVTLAAKRLIESFVTSSPTRDRGEERRKARERAVKRFGGQSVSS